MGHLISRIELAKPSREMDAPLFIDPVSDVIGSQISGRNTILVGSDAEKIISLLEELPSRVDVSLANTTVTGGGSEAKTIHASANISLRLQGAGAGNASAGLRAVADTRFLEAQPWLLIPESIHVGEATAWIVAGGERYEAVIDGLPIPVLCRIAG